MHKIKKILQVAEPVKNKSKAKLQERQSKSAYLQIYLSSKNI